jgi:hypothetical protein
MLGFGFNLIFAQAPKASHTYHYINGAPFVPALVLLVVVLLLCPESPRYHLMKGPNYSPERAYQILRTLRNTELQALRDMYTVHKSIEEEYMGSVINNAHAKLSPGFWWTIRDFGRQFRQLFQQRRLYNAVMSTSTVALAQQLCGGKQAPGPLMGWKRLTRSSERLCILLRNLVQQHRGRQDRCYGLQSSLW